MGTTSVTIYEVQQDVHAETDPQTISKTVGCLCYPYLLDRMYRVAQNNYELKLNENIFLKRHKMVFEMSIASFQHNLNFERMYIIIFTV